MVCSQAEHTQIGDSFNAEVCGEILPGRIPLPALSRKPPLPLPARDERGEGHLPSNWRG